MFGFFFFEDLSRPLLIVICCQYGYTALMMAAEQRHVGIVHLLLRAGATVDDKCLDVRKQCIFSPSL